MIPMLVGVAALLAMIGAELRLVSRRRSKPLLLERSPQGLRNVRILRDGDELREVARRAFERESALAHAADRRAAHFDRLTRSRPHIAVAPEPDFARTRSTAAG